MIESATRCPKCGKESAQASPLKMMVVFFMVVIAVMIFMYMRKQPQATTASSAEVLTLQAPKGMLAPMGEPLLDSLIKEVNGHLLSNNCVAAIPLLERALKLREDQAGRILLGQCLVETDPSRALLYLRQALQEGVDSVTLAPWIAKAERLVRENQEMGQVRSSHFVLWSEAKSETWEASPQLLAELEQLYDQFALRFDYQPSEPLQAVLFMDSTYRIPGIPDWTGALFDGKIRIPLNVMKEWPKHRGTLAHELAHAFLHSMARGQVPIWFDEGVAQILEERVFSEEERTMELADSLSLTQPFLQSGAERARQLYFTSWVMCQRILPANVQSPNSLSGVRDWLQSPTDSHWASLLSQALHSSP